MSAPLSDLRKVADHGAHSDDGAIVDDRVVDHRPVPKGDALADTCPILGAGMDDDSLFDGGFVADLDGTIIAT